MAAVGVLLPVPLVVALPKREGLAGFAPKPDEPPADEAPTLPKRPPPPVDPVFELFWLEPKDPPAVPNRPPLDVPLDAGAPKVKDMAMCCRGRRTASSVKTEENYDR